jgi:hypothetical protein
VLGKCCAAEPPPSSPPQARSCPLSHVADHIVTRAHVLVTSECAPGTSHTLALVLAGTIIVVGRGLSVGFLGNSL